MRAIVCFLAVLICLATVPGAFAQVPQTINFQGLLTDAGGQVINGTHDLTFKIYNVSTGGSELWTETHSSVTITDGLFSVILGSVVAIALPFNDGYFVGVTIDTDAELTPRFELTSAAYSLNTSRIGGRDVSNTAPSSGQVLEWNGSSWAPGTDNAGFWSVSGSNVYRSSGFVGFRTSSPGRDLHVKQSDGLIAGTGGMRFESVAGTDTWDILHTGIHFSFIETGVRRAYVEGGTGNWIQPSDARLKSDVATADPVLDRLMQLRPVRYRYTDAGEYGREMIGFIAQEVQKLFPELVSESEDGYLGLAMSEFAVVAIKAIQEQQTLIQRLEKRIEALEAR